MTIEPAKWEDLIFVIQNARPEDKVELLAHLGADVTPDDTASMLANASIVKYAVFGNEGSLLGVMGVAQSSAPGVPPSTASLWFICVPGIEKVIWSLTRRLKECLTECIDMLGFDSAEVVSLSGFDQAHHWIRILGGKHLDRLQGFGHAGEDFELFIWKN